MREFDKSALKRIRKERGLTQKELAERLKIRPQAVQQLENSDHKPNITTLEKIMNVFDVPESYFFTDKVKGTTVPIKNELDDAA